LALHDKLALLSLQRWNTSCKNPSTFSPFLTLFHPSNPSNPSATCILTPTRKREAFSKPLIDQPVVRHRLAKAGALLESQWAWVEQFVYQMTKLPKATADVELGGLTAMAKAQAGIVLNECAQCAQLLFGGSGYTKSGQGELIESKSDTFFFGFFSR